MDVVVCQMQEVTGDAPVDPLWVSPVLEVIMVREDNHWVGASDEEVSPVFQASDDGHKFSVVDIVVSFGGVERLGVISHRSLPPRPFVFLVQYCSRGKCGGVNFQD